MAASSPIAPEGLVAANLLEMLPVGACVFDEQFTVREWNSKLVEWTGLSKSMVIGKPLTDHFPNLLDARYSSRLKQVFSNGMPAKYSAALHKHFLPIPVRHGLQELAGEFMVQETEVRLYSTEPRLAFCTIQDVSFQYGQLGQLKQERADLVATKQQLERTNQRLRTRNAEMDEFCYVASHDLQEPLSRLITMGQLLEQTCRSSIDSHGLQCLDGVLDSSRKMRGIIIDLVALSKASRAEPRIVGVRVRDSIEIALELLSQRIYENQAEIELDDLFDSADQPVALADAVLLSQVFQNLLSNAIKFSNDNTTPHIKISAHRDAANWVFQIVDNGIGIEAEDRDKVFRPFKQLRKGMQPHDGSGVGLTICRKAVHQMGGEISMSSHEGPGCTVTFTLAACDADAVAQGSECAFGRKE